jgi:hypothetical protein
VSPTRCVPIPPLATGIFMFPFGVCAGRHFHLLRAPRSPAPPSVLPDIFPTWGEIGKLINVGNDRGGHTLGGADAQPLGGWKFDTRSAQTLILPISPQVGEIGRTEGGAAPPTINLRRPNPQ